MAVNERFNRQELIEGWNQEALTKARIAVVGSGPLADYTLVSLTALGIGNIEIYTDAKHDGSDFLAWKAQQGTPVAKALESILHEMNPQARIRGIATVPSGPLVSLLGKPSAIISTEPWRTQAIGLYAQERGIPFVSAAAYAERAQMSLAGLDVAGYDGSAGIVPSGVMGGMITEEVRKMLMPIDGTDVPAKKLSYSLAAERRFASDEGELRGDLHGKKALIVGAGALGNFAALAAALEGIDRIDILDYDTVDSTNLNRQVLFYDAVGKEKAPALAARIKEIAPKAEVRGIVGKLDEASAYFAENRPDIILDCVDSFAVRAIINYFAVRERIPLVSGGTNPRSGQVIAYVPEESACLDCKISVEQALAEERKAASCRYAPDPSVIMTNQIIGTMMVGEAEKVLDHGYGQPVRRILKYDSTAPSRGGLVGTADPCNCTKPVVDEWLKQLDSKKV